ACDSNAARPALGGMASDEKQMRRAKLAERSDASALSAFSFHHAQPPLPHQQLPEKTTKYVRHITSKKGVERNSRFFY
ncbi:MAG TPA: hypothetical protein O0Y06_04445, partial [Methanocorpusculum sp.]|nr:hypothetical protein [Methanocorpusculum sp.]HJK80132.1 hypothetical protein [Methanocorpusculum sp.]